MNSFSTTLHGRTRLLALVALAIAIALLSSAAARMPYFPGDVALAKSIQSLIPMRVPLAQWITATALAPWCFVLLALSVLTAWWISGWRAALVAVAVFFGLWLFGIWLSPLVAQPRPSPALIHVFGHPQGFAFPSIFGLLYAATFGHVALLAHARLRGSLAIALAVVSLLILLISACARIVLGAHWLSDLWVAFLIGLFWIELLLPASGGET